MEGNQAFEVDENTAWFVETPAHQHKVARPSSEKHVDLYKRIQDLRMDQPGTRFTFAARLARENDETQGVHIIFWHQRVPVGNFTKTGGIKDVSHHS